MDEGLAERLAEIIRGYVGNHDWRFELAEKLEAEAREYIKREKAK